MPTEMSYFRAFLKTNIFYKNAQKIRFCGGGGGANTTKAHFVKQEVIEVPDIDVDKWAKGKKEDSNIKDENCGCVEEGILMLLGEGRIDVLDVNYCGLPADFWWIRSRGKKHM